MQEDCNHVDKEIMLGDLGKNKQKNKKQKNQQQQTSFFVCFHHNMYRYLQLSSFSIRTYSAQLAKTRLESTGFPLQSSPT